MTVDACHPPDVPARVGLLLGSPAGRLFLAGCLGYSFGDTLHERLGLGPVPGTAPLARRGARRAATSPPRQWRDVPPGEVRAVVAAAVARGRWRGLLDLDEFGLLTALAGAHPDIGGVIAGDEGTWALLELAQAELRPVAEALVSAPAARRWWEPVSRGDQRFLEWDDWPRLTGQAVRWAVHDGMTAQRTENERGLRWAEQRGGPAGGCWWSVPEFTVQSMTTRGFGAVSAIALSRFLRRDTRGGPAVIGARLDHHVPAIRQPQTEHHRDLLHMEQHVGGFATQMIQTPGRQPVRQIAQRHIRTVP